jgi:hypothetical protein
MIIGVATYKLLILFLFIFFNLMNSKNGWHLYISPSRILFNIAWGIEIKRLSPAIVTTENDAPIKNNMATQNYWPNIKQSTTLYLPFLNGI